MNSVTCNLCPNTCVLSYEGQYGSCGVRMLKNGEIINPFSGILAADSIDPIEKKPLFHFYPGSSIYSIGFFGCTLHCKFCQNHSISQNQPPEGMPKISPRDMVYFLNEKNQRSIAFTYSEPTLYYEWVLEVAKQCRVNNIKTVLVTNGYLNDSPARELLKYIDAVNVDLKSYNPDFYKKICYGKLEPVKSFIKIAYNLGVHVEITTLVITDANDSLEECGKIVDFIESISKDIPFHISRYYPIYKMTNPQTSLSTIEKWVNLAKDRLNYVYTGNTPKENNTICKKCGKILIERSSYNTIVHSIDNDGKCLHCKTENNIIM